MKTEYVCGFLFDHLGSRVVLIRKKRPAWQNGLLNGVGGHIENAESTFEAMRREFREEACVDFMEWKQFCELSGVDFIITFYAAFHDGAFRVAKTGGDEPIEKLYLRDITPGMCISNLHWLIPLAVDHHQNSSSLLLRDVTE